MFLVLILPLLSQGVLYPFAANSEEDMEAWLRTIGKGTSFSLLYHSQAER
jgi:hypothetical protein